MVIKDGTNANAVTFKNRFIWLQEKLDEQLANDTVINCSDNLVLSFKKSEYDEEVPPNLIDATVYVKTTEEAGKDFDTLMGARFFDYPKPVSLIKYLLFTNTSDNDLILDFFGGSGTTGQAVTELNLEDGGSRQYILVQLPEAIDEQSEAYRAGFKKISDITIARNKRVIQKIERETAAKIAEIQDLERQKVVINADITMAKASAAPRLLDDDVASKTEQKQVKALATIDEKVAKLTDAVSRAEQLDKGFKVLRLQKSNFPRVMFEPLPDSTDEQNYALFQTYLREKESQLTTAFNHSELVTEIVLKRGFDLNYTVTEQPHFTKNRVVLVTDVVQTILLCLDAKLDAATVIYFKTHTEQRFICLERALDTTDKTNLTLYLKENFVAF